MQDESPVALARITPVSGLVPRRTTPSEKAAIIVRLMLAEGAPLSLADMPEQHQTRLAEQMARMGLVDRATLAAVVDAVFAALSPRMVQQLRDDMAARGTVTPKDADAAFTAITTAIRQLEAAGELTLKQDDA